MAGCRRALIVELEVLERREGVVVGLGALLAGALGAVTVLAVEVAAARGAQPRAVGLAQHHERRVEHHGVRDRLGEVERALGADDVEAVLERLGVVGLVNLGGRHGGQVTDVMRQPARHAMFAEMTSVL